MKDRIKSLLKSKWTPIIIIFIVSLGTHLIFFGYPDSTVFDEVHIGKFVSWYLGNSYFFDVHPPLGKMIFVSFAYVFGGDITNVDFSKIGNVLPQWVVMLRLIPVFAGITLPLLVYGILNYLKIPRNLAFLGALLICFENSLIVQSRFLMTDSLFLMFGFLSLFLYLVYRDNGSRHILFLAVLSAVACFGIKWIGLSFFMFIMLFEMFHRGRKSIKFIATSLLLLIVFYISIFAIHFSVLPKSGNGDVYMTIGFQKNLIGNQYEYDDSIVAKTSFREKFIELNREMLRANNSLTTPHQYSSLWYTWPAMQRTIYYWNDLGTSGTSGTSGISGTSDTFGLGDTNQSYLYFIGNPVLYWGGAVSILILLILTLFSLIFKRKKIKEVYVEVFVLIGFLSNFLPFMLIGRIMFLYHYAVALVFSIMAMIILLGKVKNRKTRGFLYTLIFLVTLSLFLFFSPLTYGTEITEKQLNARVWFASWR